MKKASFFIILGLAILLLFGCAGGGGGLLGGVSKDPEGRWVIALYTDDNNDDIDGYEHLEWIFYINVEVNDAKDGYEATAEDKDGDLLPGVEVPTFTYKDKVVKLEIKKGTAAGGGNYYLKLEGEFHNGSSDSKDVMIGTYKNDWDASDKGIWVAMRKGSPYLSGASIDDPEILAERAKEIEGLVEKELGYKIKIDLSELMK